MTLAEAAIAEALRRRKARAADNLEAYAAANLWIQDKNKQARRLALNPAQRHYLANRTGRDLILKARQLGFSTLIQADFLRLAVTQAVGTMTLSHEDDSTQRLRRMADFYYEHLPEPHPRRKYSNASVTTYPDTRSEAAIGTAGGRNAGRSFTLTHLHGSEVAFWPDAESIIAGALQAGNPAAVLESTANGAQGYFYDLCMEALDGNGTWKLHFYPWWWDSEYRLPVEEPLQYTDEEYELAVLHQLDQEQIAWRRYKQSELKHLFLQEYPEDPVTCFLLSGMGYFGDIGAVRRVKPGTLTPDSGHTYYAGLDFAQTVDWTALSIIDANSGAEVDLLRLQHMSWAEMRKRVIERLMYWNVKRCLAEANSMGTTNIEAMHEEARAAGWSGALIAFKTDNASKAGIMSGLHEGMHSGALAVLDDVQRIKELRVFTSRQTATGLWQLSAPDNEHDDTVISVALAWHTAQLGAGDLPRQPQHKSTWRPMSDGLGAGRWRRDD